MTMFTAISCTCSGVNGRTVRISEVFVIQLFIEGFSKRIKDKWSPSEGVTRGLRSLQIKMVYFLAPKIENAQELF